MKFFVFIFSIETFTDVNWYAKLSFVKFPLYFEARLNVSEILFSVKGCVLKNSKAPLSSFSFCKVSKKSLMALGFIFALTKILIANLSASFSCSLIKFVS